MTKTEELKITIVAIYCRISKDKGEKDKSIEDQLETGKEFCDKNGYSYKEYIDDGISGTIGERPEFQNLLADITDGKIDIVWVLDDSRIQRNPEIRYLINKTLKDNNVQYHTGVDGVVDLYDPQKDLMGGVLAEFNKYFVAITKTKVKSVLKRRALQGKGWGALPYGWSYDKEGYYVQKEDECKVVKRIYKLSLDGVGTDRIARMLNDECVPTRYNGYEGEIRLNKSKGAKYTKKVKKEDVKWAGNTINGILNNSMFYGKKKIKDIIFDVPPLFSIDYWSEVNYNLKNNNSKNNTKGGKVKYDYLLRGLIKCGKCGMNYSGKTRVDKKDHFYYCMSKRNGESCGNRSINIDHIEALVWNSMFFEGKLYKEIKNEIGSEKKRTEYLNVISDLKLKLQKSQNAKNNILDSVMNGVFSMEEVSEKMTIIRKEIEQFTNGMFSNEEKLKRLNDSDVNELKYMDKLEELSFEKKNELLQKFIQDVNIHWIETTIQGVNVRYYKVVVNYKFADITHVYTNGYGLDFSMWYEVKYSSMRKEVYYNTCIWINHYGKYRYGQSLGGEVPFIHFKGDIFPEYTTMVPYGDVESWEEDELENYYGGKKRYNRFKTEFEHKLNSNTFSTSLLR